MAIYVAGEFLVFEGQRRDVQVALSSDRGLSVAGIEVAETESPLQISGGEVGGLIAARDTVLGGFLDQFDEFAQTLTFEFNKVHAAGQGLTGFDDIISEFHVADPDAALDAAGLSFMPSSGTFDVQIFDTQTGLTETHRVDIDLDGLDDDTTLNTLAADLSAIDGISATVLTTGELTIKSDSPVSQFAFSGDTSGTLAALGINTFFRGSTAFNVGVSQVLTDDPSKVAASRGGIGHDADNAVHLAAFADQPIASNHGGSIMNFYGSVVATVTQGSTVARSVAEGLRVFEDTLAGQQLAISGVNLDEEAVRMITLQRTYQATARYIAAISELLDIMVNL